MPAPHGVKPITYLKNRTAELVSRVREGSTVTITQNGEAKVVVMDVATYERWQGALALLKIVSLGEADVSTGRTVTQADAFERARRAVRVVEQDG